MLLALAAALVIPGAGKLTAAPRPAAPAAGAPAPGIAAPATTAVFTDVTATAFPGDILPGLRYSSVAWGDYDSDGHLDLFVTGVSSASHHDVSMLYRNQGTDVFTNVTATAFPSGILPGVGGSSVAWGDYDNDGRLDLLVTGSYVSKLYHNQGGGVFADVTATAFPSGILPGVRDGSVAWGDYDNDGRLDLFLTGNAGGGVSRLYRNGGNGVFADVTATAFPSGILPSVYESSVAWGDYDNNGRLDLLVTGYHFNNGAHYVSALFQNQGNGVFADVTATAFPGGILPGVQWSSVAWGDYDNDGRLDLFLTGDTGSHMSKLYRNQGGGVFADATSTAFPSGVPLGVASGSVAWGDYNSDGRLDLFFNGINGGGVVSRLYGNQGSGVFANVTPSAFPRGILPPLKYSSVAWGDYDADGRLDLFVTGGGSQVSNLFRGGGGPPDAVPPAPTGLTAGSLTRASATLTWYAAGPPPRGRLSYALRVGTTPGGSDVLAPAADLATGTRRLPTLGPARTVPPAVSGRTMLTHLAPATTYYWSVQAIDPALMGGPFAVEASFTTLAPP